MQRMIDFQCPHCHSGIKVSEEFLGSTGNCTTCGGVITILIAPPQLKRDPETGKIVADTPPVPETAETLPQHPAPVPQAPKTHANGNGNGAARPQSPVVMMPITRDIEALHYTMQEAVRTYGTRAASDPLAKGLAIQASHQMIAIAPYVKQHLEFAYKKPLPEHVGFAHLATVLETEGMPEKARKVCLNAKFQGWAGDWDTRIARCEALTKQKKQSESTNS